MRLSLSSLDIPDVEKFLSLFDKSSPKTAVIGNAWDPYLKKRADEEIGKTITDLADVGTIPEHMDLRIFVRDEGGLTEALQGYDGVYVTGGNSFYLNFILHRTGMKEALKKAPSNFVYAGASAGAVVAGSTLHGIEFLDDIHAVQQPNFEGMNLVPYGIIPHWDSPKYGEKLRACHMEMEKFAEVKTLRDEEIWVT